MNGPWILGISASHNGAVCLLNGDEIVVAIQEERLSRIKRHRTAGARSSLALEYCFDYAKILPRDLSMVVLSVQGRVGSPSQDLRLNPFLKVLSNGVPTLTVSHHFAHGMSAYATSGFKDAAVLVIDGAGSPSEDLSEDERSAIIGEGWESISLYAASDTSMRALEKHLARGFLTLRENGMPTFRSLGGMFSAVSKQIFGDPLEAGKVMGLAPYGRPEITAEDFLEISDGRITFFDKVPQQFEHNDRWPSHETEYKNLACSTQVALEKALMYLASHIRDLYPSKNLCYAGGVALNSVANERIIREVGFDKVYIMPAAEDSGPAIGAAYYGLWQLTKTNTGRRLVHDAVGRKYSSSDILNVINRAPSVKLVDSKDIISDVVDLLCEGKIIGWFQGGSELGPRALGQRSILCDPRRPDGKEVLNGKVKHREAFRPFAPAILLEEAKNWFDIEGNDEESPFMLRVCPFKKGKMELVPAVAHVDGSGRLQTVTKEANGSFYDLVKKFYEKTGVPIVLNTSFNTMGEPIIETPEDALSCLLHTGIDYCVLEDRLVMKKKEFRALAMTAFLDRVGRIKGRLGKIDPLKGEQEKVRAMSRAIEKIHEAVVKAVPAYKEEIRRHLGCTPPDLEPGNSEKLWRETFLDQPWEALEKETREYLINAGLIYACLTKYPSRKKDWCPVNIEFIKAVKTELNQKLVFAFALWVMKERPMEVEALAALSDPSNKKDSGIKALLSLRDLAPAQVSLDISLDSICWALNNIDPDGPSRQGMSLQPPQIALLELLREFTGSFKDATSVELLKAMPHKVENAVSARNNSLRAEFLNRDRVIDFMEDMGWLMLALCHIAQASLSLRG